MEHTKAQIIHKKIDSLSEGIAKRLMEVYTELANSRYILSVLVNQNIDIYPEVNEEAILDDIKNYFIVTDRIAINMTTTSFVKLNLIVRNYKLDNVTEDKKFTFKYQGIVGGSEDEHNKDYTLEANNEQQAWQLLREILINNVTTK